MCIQHNWEQMTTILLIMTQLKPFEGLDSHLLLPNFFLKLICLSQTLKSTNNILFHFYVAVCKTSKFPNFLISHQSSTLPLIMSSYVLCSVDILFMFAWVKRLCDPQKDAFPHQHYNYHYYYNYHHYLYNNIVWNAIKIPFRYIQEYLDLRFY